MTLRKPYRQPASQTGNNNVTRKTDELARKNGFSERNSMKRLKLKLLGIYRFICYLRCIIKIEHLIIKRVNVSTTAQCTQIAFYVCKIIFNATISLRLS